MYMHSFQGGATLLSLGLIFLLYTMFVWWRDVLRESTLEGHHTKAVQLGLRYGFILFIVSEVMFFFAFFWAFFSFFFGTYGRDRRYLAPKGDWGFRSLGNTFSYYPDSPFIRSCRNLGLSCYTRGEGKTS
ncbi:hypothetical protein LUZ63_024281 [Rhynchospora breviuscula]|uniref:Cytochrome c oxidase subunit 3 n=1 Tax=Rhynchospora breviuscula TaxID=2022672 RepID=A0A9P9Z1D8_9POAL|nr:hypothetical protein LUZ63_024281 [Rhynchospora breviuscula]